MRALLVIETIFILATLVLHTILGLGSEFGIVSASTTEILHSDSLTLQQQLAPLLHASDHSFPDCYSEALQRLKSTPDPCLLSHKPHKTHGWRPEHVLNASILSSSREYCGALASRTQGFKTTWVRCSCV